MSDHNSAYNSKLIFDTFDKIFADAERQSLAESPDSANIRRGSVAVYDAFSVPELNALEDILSGSFSGSAVEVRLRTPEPSRSAPLGVFIVDYCINSNYRSPEVDQKPDDYNDPSYSEIDIV